MGEKIIETGIEIIKPKIVKQPVFDFYMNDNIRWVRFNFKGKDYDIPEKEAEKMFLAAGCFLLFLLLISLLAQTLDQPK